MIIERKILDILTLISNTYDELWKLQHLHFCNEHNSFYQILTGINEKCVTASFELFPLFQAENNMAIPALGLKLLESMRSALDICSRGNHEAAYQMLSDDIIPSFQTWHHAVQLAFPNANEQMPAHNPQVDIIFKGSSGSLLVMVDLDQNITWKSIMFGKDLARLDFDFQHYIIVSMLEAVKEVFFKMPIEPTRNIHIKFILDEEFKPDENLLNMYLNLTNYLSQIMSATNQTIQNYRHLKGTARDYENIMFYVFSEAYRLKSMFDSCQEKYPDKAIYKEYPSGWNSIERHWEPDRHILPCEELISMLRDNRVKKLVVLNYYLYEDYLFVNQIYLPALLDFLGIECVGVDEDPVEQIGAIKMRSLLHYNGFNRYTLFPAFSKAWDELYNNRNIHYVPPLQHYMKGQPGKLDDDYSLLVLSNSRLDDVKSVLPIILCLLNEMRADPFTEIELWFFSLRKIIMLDQDINEYQKMIFIKNLFYIMYIASNFLKYEVISSVSSRRRLKIFGDAGWGVLFPSYYQNKHLNAVEIGKLHAQGKHLLLLMNNCFSYLEAGGPIFDAISKNIPFINFPALVKTSEFEGFRHIEYRDREELNRLVDNVLPAYKNQELLSSIDTYQNIMIAGETDFTRQVYEDIPFPEDGGIYYKKCKEHQIILDAMIDEYTQNRAGLLTECLNKLFLEPDMEYYSTRALQTIYGERDYVFRILKGIE